VFVENYESIETSLDVLDYDLGYVFDGIGGPQAMMEYFSNEETPHEIQDIMIAYGLGSDGLEKFTIIILGAYGFHISEISQTRNASTSPVALKNDNAFCQCAAYE